LKTQQIVQVFCALTFWFFPLYGLCRYIVLMHQNPSLSLQTHCSSEYFTAYTLAHYPSSFFTIFSLAHCFPMNAVHSHSTNLLPSNVPHCSHSHTLFPRISHCYLSVSFYFVTQSSQFSFFPNLRDLGY